MGLLQLLADTEIRELDLSQTVHQNIFRFYISVDLLLLGMDEKQPRQHLYPKISDNPQLIGYLICDIR